MISDSVFEHLKDPFKTIDELKRVIKPGGEIYIETAFLQPIHAYPNHYYNMTKHGLENLCACFEKVESGIQPHQYPSFTLTRILRTWLEKLDGAGKDDFLGKTIKEVFDEYASNVYSKRWMDGFSSEDIEELAVGSYFHGRKKS